MKGEERWGRPKGGWARYRRAAPDQRGKEPSQIKVGTLRDGSRPRSGQELQNGKSDPDRGYFEGWIEYRVK